MLGDIQTLILMVGGHWGTLKPYIFGFFQINWCWNMLGDTQTFISMVGGHSSNVFVGWIMLGGHSTLILVVGGHSNNVFSEFLR